MAALGGTRTVELPDVAAVADADAILVERHRHGDRSAFAELYGRYGSLVYNLAFRLAGSAEDAEDLTQEVFLRIYRHLATFRGRSSLRTWVYRVTLNHCRSALGRRARRGWQSTEGNAEGVADVARDPERRAAAAEDAARVHAALAALPSPFREAVVLRDLEGLAYDEIAALLKVRPGTVRSRIARGRQALRGLLEDTA